MANETKHVPMGKAQLEKLDQVLRGICKERKVAVEADLDSRLSYRERDEKNPKAASWGAYSRFLLSDGHTVYVNLRTMEGSVSKNPDKLAQGKVEKRLAKQKRIADRKAAKEAKAAAKAAEPTVKPTAEPKPKKVANLALEIAQGHNTSNEPKAAKKPAVKRVKFDKDLPTLEGTEGRQVKK